LSKNIIISAAADGIGWSITSSLLEEGYTVYASDINQKKIDELKSHPLINERLFVDNVDAADVNSVKNYFESIKLSSIHALINNVGVAGPTGTMEDISVDDWNQTIAGIYGFPLRTPYAASKWAIIGVTKSLAMELGKFNIRVNAICPIAINKVKEDFEEMVSLKTFVDKEDIANMAVFLLSSQAQKVSGQIMTVDGNTERMN